MDPKRGVGWDIPLECSKVGEPFACVPPALALDDETLTLSLIWDLFSSFAFFNIFLSFLHLSPFLFYIFYLSFFFFPHLSSFLFHIFHLPPAHHNLNADRSPLIRKL